MRDQGTGALLRGSQELAEVSYRIEVRQEFKEARTTLTEMVPGLVHGEVNFDVIGSEPEIKEGEDLALRLADGSTVPVRLEFYLFGSGRLNLRPGAADTLLGYNPLP